MMKHRGETDDSGDWFDDELSRIIRKSADELTKTQDHYIFDFFGSIENFMEFGHLYILEEYPVEISRVEFEGFDEDPTTIRFTQEFRIRKKTPEELVENSMPLTKNAQKTLENWVENNK